MIKINPNNVADLIGVLFEIYIIVTYFKTLWNGNEKDNSGRLDVIMMLISAILLSITAFMPKNSYSMLLIALLISFLLTIKYHVSLVNRLFFTVLIIVILYCGEIITGTILVLSSGYSVNEITSNFHLYFEGVIISKFCVFVFVKLFGLIKKRQESPVSKRIILSIMLTPISSMLSIYLISYYAYYITDTRFVSLSTIAMCLVLISNIFVFYVFEKQTKIELASQRLKFYEAELQNQKEHYNELYNSQSEIRKIRHDLKNNLIAISGYLSVGDSERAVDYINELSEEPKVLLNTIDTGHPALDAVLQSKIKKASFNSCKISYSVYYCDDSVIDQMDIAIIVANALDNAIEACALCEDDDKRVIRLQVIEKGDYLSLFVENPIIEGIDVGKITTTKPDKINHGYGLTSIKAISEKYQGDVSIACSSTKFVICVLLKNV